MNDDEELSAILGSSTKCSTMADGTLRIQVDIKPEDAQNAFKLFGTPGSAIALARITDAAAVEIDRPKPEKGPYGKFAQALVASGFFRIPRVWEGIGTDEEYLEWVKHQPCALTGNFSEHHDSGEQYCVPAHVRRVEHGSGTGIKPRYSAIPLMHDLHQQAHQHGDTTLCPEEWWQKQRIKHIEKWAFETLKKRLNYDSYTEIPPTTLVAWATQRDLMNYLPFKFHGEDTESKTESTA